MLENDFPLFLFKKGNQNFYMQEFKSNLFNIINITFLFLIFCLGYFLLWMPSVIIAKDGDLTLLFKDSNFFISNFV